MDPLMLAAAACKCPACRTLGPMFTGIVEELGTVRRSRRCPPSGAGVRLTHRGRKCARRLVPRRIDRRQRLLPDPGRPGVDADGAWWATDISAETAAAHRLAAAQRARRSRQPRASDGARGPSRRSPGARPCRLHRARSSRPRPISSFAYPHDADAVSRREGLDRGRRHQPDRVRPDGRHVPRRGDTAHCRGHHLGRRRASGADGQHRARRRSPSTSSGCVDPYRP